MRDETHTGRTDRRCRRHRHHGHRNGARHELPDTRTITPAQQNCTANTHKGGAIIDAEFDIHTIIDQHEHIHNNADGYDHPYFHQHAHVIVHTHEHTHGDTKPDAKRHNDADEHGHEYPGAQRDAEAT